MNKPNVGKDISADVQRVEQQFNASGLYTADAAVANGPGFLHTIIISPNDAAPTAGSIDVYDNVLASGKKLLSWTLTTAVFTPVSVLLDCKFEKGIYVDFGTTADVNVSFSYRQ